MQHADDRHVRAQAGATDLHKVRLCSILQVMLHAILQVAQVVWLHLCRHTQGLALPSLKATYSPQRHFS